jgi:O-antigen/teichoic acid export membrane protein
VTPQSDTALQMRLRDRAFIAGLWTLLGYGFDLVFKLASTLILTRLLFPEAFGAVAAASALIAGLTLISDFGVAQVIVQSPRGDQVDFLRSAWVFLLWRSLALWVIVLGLCALLNASAIKNLLPAGSIYADPSFALVTASLGFCLVLGGAESTCTFLNIRRLNYRPLIIPQLASRIFTLPIMVIWAWIAPSVWALVGGSVAGAILRLLLSHTIVPGPWMSLKWNQDHLREIVRVGRWFTLSSFGAFLSLQSDVILLGFLVPSSILGLYSIAKIFVGVSEGLLDRLTNSLALPVLSEVLRKNPNNFRSRYYHFRLPVEIAAGLLSGTLFAAGHFLIYFLYDTRYAEAGTLLPILALATAIYPSYSIIRHAFAATAEIHIFTAISIVQALSLIICLSVGFIAFGLIGAVWGVALHRVVPSLMTTVLARQRNWITPWRELVIIPAFLVGFLAGKSVVLLATTIGFTNIHQIIHH